MSNAERNARIVGMRKAGLLPREIAKQLGVTKNVVIGVTNRAGLAVPGLSSQCVPRGISHPKAKLSDANIIAIRGRYVPFDREHGQCALARAYGVTQATIARIVNGSSWAHVR